MLEEEFNPIQQDNNIQDYGKDQRLRALAVSFMTNYGVYFELTQLTIAKAICIFHRATIQLSLKESSYFLYGAAAVFLTSKLDDAPRALEHLVKIFDYMYGIYEKEKQAHASEKNFEPTYKDLSVAGCRNHKIDKEKLKELKEKFTDTESNILNLIGYDFDIELPYHYLDFIKTNPIIPHASFLGIANNFINDSMRTLACLYYEPRIIALAALNLSSFFFNYKMPVHNEQAWYKCFGDDVEFNIVEEATKYLMELYKQQD